MSHIARAAGMILGGVGGLSLHDPEGGAAGLFAAYAEAGIRAFLFPGSLLPEPEVLSRLVAAARRATAEAGKGQALIAMGGEGSPAFGLPPFPQAPSPLCLASSRSAAAARRAGQLLGLRLAECGIDMVLAPRLDLASDPKDPAGALGGFGEDSRLAGVLGSDYIRGLASAGVAACVGRFPGLGTTCRDCYEGMAFVALPVERLERCEMRPFSRAVDAGTAAVLVGRVLVPALESEHIPASSSARVIEGRLRESLGFRGLVIGDDIDPGEEPGKAAILGALAGCDLGMFSRPGDALAAASALEKAAATGELPAIRVEMGRRRLDSLLSKRARLVPNRSAVSERRMRKAKRDMEDGASEFRGSLALDGAKTGNYSSAFVLVFVPSRDAPDASESESVLEALQAELPGAEILGITADPGPGETDEIARRIAPRGRFADAAILTYDAHFRPAQEGLARLVEEFIPRYRIIAMRDPYDAAFFPGAMGLGAAYGFSEGCAQAVARLLAGKSRARGGRPVEVIGLEI
jgi:beta-N-acetylhexosaminidase